MLAGLGLGIALAGAPGPVQAVLLSETLRGGLPRGFRAMAGANLTLGALLVALALGVSLTTPSQTVERLLKIIGGLFLAFIGVDGLRHRESAPAASTQRRSLPPAARGVLAVVLNPGVWLFLATAASSLLAGATQTGGRTIAVLAALALLLGVAAGDGTVVLAGGLGARRVRAGPGQYLRAGLAVVLVLLGGAFVIDGAPG